MHLYPYLATCSGNHSKSSLQAPEPTGVVSYSLNNSCQHHPSVHRTPVESLPYLYDSSSNKPLDPAKSHFIGLALIRGIDEARRCLHLTTPISKHKIQELNDQRYKVVLVLGKFDTPTWAYTDDITLDPHGMLQAEREAGPFDQLVETARKLRRVQIGRRPWIAWSKDG